MQTNLQDLRYCVRQFLRSPGFTAIAIITLALGVGATAAIFSFVNAVLLKPLPYPDPERIVSVAGKVSGRRQQLHFHSELPRLGASESLFSISLSHRLGHGDLDRLGQPRGA